MISEGTERFVVAALSGPPVLVGYALALENPRVRRMLEGHARRFQPDQYAPELHALAVVQGLVAGLKSNGEEAPGNEAHGALHIDPELMYEVGATLTVLAVRAHAAALVARSESFTIGQSYELVTAFDRTMLKYGAAQTFDVAWMIHEARVDAAMKGLEPSPTQAAWFWENVVSKLPDTDAVGPAVVAAFHALTTPLIADVYSRAFYEVGGATD